MADPYITDTPKLKLKINGTVGLANRQPPITEAEFDSEIIGYEDRTSNADLKITLKVFFEAKGPPASPSGKPVSFVKSWGTDPQTVLHAGPSATGYNDGNFADFKKLVLKEANSFWNAKMWLVTPSKYDGLDWLPIPYATNVRPNIHCLFNAIEAASPSQAHLTIACWRLASGTDCMTYGSKSTEYDNYDLVFADYPLSSTVGTGTTQLPAGTNFHRLTVWHEMGHAIGQFHSASTISGCSDVGCYGDMPSAEPWMTKNVMGVGTDITSYNGKPWAKRMAQHTNGLTTEADWITWTSRPAPVQLP